MKDCRNRYYEQKDYTLIIRPLEHHPDGYSHRVELTAAGGWAEVWYGMTRDIVAQGIRTVLRQSRSSAKR